MWGHAAPGFEDVQTSTQDVNYATLCDLLLDLVGLIRADMSGRLLLRLSSLVEKKTPMFLEI